MSVNRIEDQARLTLQVLKRFEEQVQQTLRALSLTDGRHVRDLEWQVRQSLIRRGGLSPLAEEEARAKVSQE